MSRHPLLFVSVLVFLSVGLGTVIAMLLLVLRAQDRHTKTLRAIGDDLDELTSGPAKIGEVKEWKTPQ